MTAARPWVWRSVAACLPVLLLALAAGAGHAEEPAEDGVKPLYPMTEFTGDDKTTAVSAGNITATITMVKRPELDPDVEVPLLEVSVAGKKVAESAGTGSVSDEPGAVASIAEIDPGNTHPEVYFSSYNGGCCSTVIVVEEVGGKWVPVPIGDFDGDEDYLQDLDGDGLAEIATVDIRFINRFDCTACSASPRVIYTVRDGKVVDLTTDTRFFGAHREWLKTIEESIDPEERWKSPGFLAGWLGEKIRLGEGGAAWQEINSHWDFTSDEGEEVCPNGDDPDQCERKDRKLLKFPERLRLFLASAGYKF